MNDLISRKDAIDALCNIDEYNSLSVKTIRELPSAQPNIHPDGTLIINVPDLDTVQRVLVSSGKWCKVFYLDEE